MSTISSQDRQSSVPQAFHHDSYLVRRKVLKFFGGAFHIYDPNGEVAFYSKMKAFKLKEDIRLYTGEDMQTEILTILARQIIDISAAYDVIDATTGAKVGALKRRGLKSILKDEWIIMDAEDREIGLIKEDSAFLALVPGDKPPMASAEVLTGSTPTTGPSISGTGPPGEASVRRAVTLTTGDWSLGHPGVNWPMFQSKATKATSECPSNITGSPRTELAAAVARAPSTASV